MAISLYEISGHQAAYAVTKIDASWEDCAFILDFSRPLETHRWCGFNNRHVGILVALSVPIIHISETEGEFVMYVPRSDPHFQNVRQLWRTHRGEKRTLFAAPLGGLETVADFGRHFPENC